MKYKSYGECYCPVPTKQFPNSLDIRAKNIDQVYLRETTAIFNGRHFENFWEKFSFRLPMGVDLPTHLCPILLSPHLRLLLLVLFHTLYAVLRGLAMTHPLSSSRCHLGEKNMVIQRCREMIEMTWRWPLIAYWVWSPMNSDQRFLCIPV